MFLLTLLVAAVVGSVAQLPTFEDPPQQLHLAAASRTSMRISWKTSNVTESVCTYGKSDHLLSSTATGPAGVQYMPKHGYHHTVLLTDLPASTT